MNERELKKPDGRDLILYVRAPNDRVGVPCGELGHAEYQLVAGGTGCNPF